MKELRFQGVEVKIPVTGKIGVNDDIRISKISPDGMLLETRAKLTMGGSCMIRIRSGDKGITVRAKVLNVLLKSMVEENGVKQNISQAIVEFRDLDDGERSFLNDVIESSIEKSLPSFDSLREEIKGSRFRSRE